MEGWPEEAALYVHSAEGFDGNWGDSKNVPPAEKKLLIDQVVGSICSCFIGPETNEAVEVQVIKVRLPLSLSPFPFSLTHFSLSSLSNPIHLSPCFSYLLSPFLHYYHYYDDYSQALLAAVTTSSVGLHGQALLTSIRTCYNIFLLSQSLGNQQTAKATLTQMINAVFHRFEGQQTEVSDSFFSSFLFFSCRVLTLMPSFAANQGVRPEDVNIKVNVDVDRMSLRSEAVPPPESPLQPQGEAPGEHGGAKSFEDWEKSQREPSEVAEEAQEGEGTSAPHSDDPSLQNPSPFDSALDATMDASHNHPIIIREGEEPDGDIQGDTSVMDLTVTNEDQHTEQAVTVSSSHDASAVVDPEQGEVDPYFKDAYLVFRALCRLSMKPVTEVLVSHLLPIMSPQISPTFLLFLFLFSFLFKCLG